MSSWIDDMGIDHNIYYTPNPCSSRMAKKPSKIDMSGGQWLYADMDLSPGKSQAEQVAGFRSLVDAGNDGLPKPTVVVFSGGGIQALWRLSSLFETNGDTDKISKYEERNRWIEGVLGADACHNIDRLLRLPGTINHPTGKKQRQGRVPVMAELLEFRSELVYDIDDFGRLAGGLDSFSEPGEFRPVSDLDAIDGITDECKSIISHGDDVITPERWGGDQSKAVFFIAGELQRLGIDDETIGGILINPEFGISDHIRRQNNPERAIERALARTAQSNIDDDIEKMNERFSIVQDHGGQCRVMWKRTDGSLKFQTKQNFIDAHAHYPKKIIQTGENTSVKIPMAKYWFEHQDRRVYESVVFRPDINASEVDGCFNMWSGFAVRANPEGDCSLYLEHVLENICSGNQEWFDYLLSWMAAGIQRPEKPAGTAIILRGEQGTGKNVFAEAYQHLFGIHGLQVASENSIVGRFAGHLVDKIFVFANEVSGVFSKAGYSKLKSLITEGQMAVEKKGLEIETQPSYLRIMMSSNEDFVVPADRKERRMVFIDVANARRRDNKYFGKLIAQLERGGYEKLLHILKTRDLSNFDIRDIPETETLRDHKARSLLIHEQWFHDKLDSRDLLWDETVHHAVVTADYEHYARRNSGEMLSRHAFWGFLRRFSERTKILRSPFKREWLGQEIVRSNTKIVEFFPHAECARIWEDYSGIPLKPVEIIDDRLDDEF